VSIMIILDVIQYSLSSPKRVIKNLLEVKHKLKISFSLLLFFSLGKQSVISAALTYLLYIFIPLNMISLIKNWFLLVFYIIDVIGVTLIGLITYSLVKIMKGAGSLKDTMYIIYLGNIPFTLPVLVSMFFVVLLKVVGLTTVVLGLIAGLIWYLHFTSGSLSIIHNISKWKIAVSILLASVIICVLYLAVIMPLLWGL